MPTAEAAHRPATSSGRTMRLWLGFLIIIAAAIGLAWLGAGSLRPQVSSTGLEFRTIKAGKGAQITRADAALLDYALSANDGSILDSSEMHGGAQPLSMSHVYPGFAEAMAKMQEGGQYRFTMPQRIAWGEGQGPQSWPKDSPVTFEVRIRKIVPGGGALLDQQMLQQRMQQQ